MFGFRNLSIRVKIVIFLVFIFVLIIAENFILNSFVKGFLLHEKQKQLISLVDTTYSIAESYYNKTKEGKLTEDEAKKLALESISQLRYEKSGYYWITDYDVKMVMHPIKPSLDGKDLSTYKDKKGKTFFLEYTNMVKEKGEWFERYWWPKPGKEGSYLKLSYLKGFPQWQWIIGTGFYIDDIEVNLRKIIETTVIYLVIFLLIFIIIAFTLNKLIFFPIKKLSEYMKDISSGEANLTQKLPVFSKDEIGELARYFNMFLDKLGEIIVNAKDISLQVSSVAEETSTSLAQVSDASQSLASTSQETSATVEEITSSIEEVANNAQDITNSSEELANSSQRVEEDANKVGDTAKIVSENSEKVKDAMEELEKSIEETIFSIEKSKEMAQDAASFSQEGQSAIDDTVTGMKNINQKVEDLVSVVDRLGKSSEEIGKIIDVISDIADQTNLLALNAAIEAARAGEHGRGFAVVADEVRKLAERSQQAAGEIGNLIRGIQQEVQNAVVSADEGKQKVEKGMELAKHAGDTFSKINESIRAITEMIETISQNSEREKEGGRIAREFTEKSLDSIEEIATLINQEVQEIIDMGRKVEEVTQRVAYISAATEEQAAAAREMRNAVETIAQAAEQSAAAIAETTRASDALAKEAEKLASVVSGFKI